MGKPHWIGSGKILRSRYIIAMLGGVGDEGLRSLNAGLLIMVWIFLGDVGIGILYGSVVLCDCEVEWHV